MPQEKHLHLHSVVDMRRKTLDHRPHPPRYIRLAPDTTLAKHARSGAAGCFEVREWPVEARDWISYTHEHGEEDTACAQKGLEMLLETWSTFRFISGLGKTFLLPLPLASIHNIPNSGL